MRKGSKLGELVSNAKTIPAAVYHILFINLVLFVGLVLRDLSLLYILGCLAYVLGVVAIFSKVVDLWELPSELVSKSVRESVDENWQKLTSAVDRLTVSKLGEDMTSTVVAVSLWLFRSCSWFICVLCSIRH